MRFTILIFALLSILSAFYFGQKIASETPQNVLYSSEERPFQVPKITNLVEEDIPPFEKHSIIAMDGIILGKYPISDSIEFKELDQDDLELETLERGEEHFYNSSGLQVFADPESMVPENLTQHFFLGQGNYFPVYLVNETKSIKSTYPQHTIDAIIEAVDSSGHTVYPIQVGSYKYCGTGKRTLRICP